MKNYHGHPKFRQILDQLEHLHSEKNRQYATLADPLANFKRVGSLIHKFLKPGIDPTLAACLALMAKQVDGVYEMVGEAKKDTPDEVDDKLRDIAVYAIIAMIITQTPQE